MRIALKTATIVAVALAFPAAASAVTESWKGTTSTSWGTSTNWSTTAPVNGDTVQFDNQSTLNLSTNNNLVGLQLLGITNTTVGGVGPAGNVSISGNALTLGSGGINYTGSPNAAIRNLSVNTDLTLSAAQNWKMGGVGLTLTVGTSPGANTVTMNGNALTLQHVGNVEFMTVNSNLVNGSSASALNFVASAGASSKTQFGMLGTNTYTGGTSVTGTNQVIQLGSSSAAGSGPLGTGNITLVSGSSYYEAYGNNRSIDNNITIGSGATLNETTSTGQAVHSLTFNGAISSPTGNRTILVDSQGTSAGSGDLIFNGTVTLGSSGVAGGTLTTGQTATAAFQPGKVIYNGNIVEAAGVTSGAVVSIVNGSPTTFVTQVVLNGQNTYSGGTTIGAGSGIVYVGSSSAGPAGSPTSGPLGKGSLTFNNGGNTPRIEPVGNQTVGNNVVLTSAGIVQGSDNLTLTGTVSGASGLTKNGTGKLTLTGTNSFSGNMTVNNGTVSVPTIAATGTNQPLGTSAGNIGVGAATTAGTLEYTGAGATTLSRQISVGAGGATIRASAATGTGLTLNAATAVSAGANAVTFDGGGNITVATPITGTATATVTKTGGGILTLSGANVYGTAGTTGTFVNVGKVLVNNTTGSGTGAGNVLVASGATLGGTGSLTGDVTVNGTYSPGASIETMDTGALTFGSGSTFTYELNSNLALAVAADLANASGALTIDPSTVLSISDAGSTKLPYGTKFTLISYSGSWVQPAGSHLQPNHFAGLPNGSSFTVGQNQWNIRYDDPTGGSNFGGGTFANHVTITAVPEAGTFIVIGLGGIFAFAAVRLGKRMGVNVLKA